MPSIVTSSEAIEEVLVRHAENESPLRLVGLIEEHPQTRTLNQRRDVMLSEAAKAWKRRCSELELRPGTKKREIQLEAFLQGVTAVMSSGRYMLQDELGHIAFMVMIGRGEEVTENWIKEDLEA